MSLTENNIRNIFIYSLPKVIGYGLSFITLPILTRILTPEDFGIIILAGIFPSIAASVTTVGLTSSIQRYYFEYRKDRDKLHALIFSCQVFLSLSFVISATGVFILKNIISKLTIGNEQYGNAIFIMFLAMFLGQVINFYLILYQNMEKATIHSTFTIAQAVLNATISLLLVWYFKMSYMGMIYGTLASTSIVCLIIFYTFNRQLHYRWDKKILIENIKYGIQIMPKSFTGLINRFFDKYMLNNMLSLSAVGVYNIGQTVGNAMFYLMGTVWSSFQPVYYREVFDKGADGAGAVGRIFTIFSYITLAPVLLLVLFAQETVYLIAPASYYGAIDIIIIISGGIATQIFGMYVGVQYAYSKKAYWIFPVTIVGTAVNVIANILLIPRFGLMGAGGSIVLTYFVLNFTLTYIGQKLFRIRYEWSTVLMLLFIIFSAIVSMLYLRHIDFHGPLLYVSKLIFISLFVLIGVKSKIITRHTIKKVTDSIVNFQQSGEVV